MDINFRPSFFRDFKKISHSPIKELVFKAIRNIKFSTSISDIQNLKKLEKYEVHYRVKIKIDKKRSYRIGLVIKRNKVWIARVLHRNKIYKVFP